MKKFLLVVLSLILVLISCSCNSTPSSYYEESYLRELSLIEAESEEATTAKKTCKDTGKHVGAGTCEECGIDYYDELVEYLKANGTQKDSSSGYTITYKLKNWHEVQVQYFESSDDITIYGIRDYVEYSPYRIGWEMVRITVKRASVKYGDYAWYGHIGDDFYDYSATLKGTFTANKINPDMAIELDADADGKYEQICLANSESMLKELINEIMPQFLKDSGTNISMVNMGFERFE